VTAIALTTPAFVRASFLKGMVNSESDDGILAAIIGALSGTGDPQILTGFEAVTNRVFPLQEYTEYLSSDGNSQRLFLHAYPITTAEVWIDSGYTWDTPSKVAATDLVIDPTGLPMVMLRSGAGWPGGYGHIKVTYTGGLIQDDTMIPSSLNLACAIQSAFVYQGRNRLGVNAESAASGSVSMFSPSVYLPQVLELLAPFVRHVF